MAAAVGIANSGLKNQGTHVLDEKKSDAVVEKCANASCDQTDKRLTLCENCLSVFYCSLACDQANWNNHKTECRIKMRRRVRLLFDKTTRITDASEKCTLPSCKKVSTTFVTCFIDCKVYYHDSECRTLDEARHKDKCVATLP